MSAILAILLMLSGALLVPHAFAQTPAGSVQCNPGAISWVYPTHAPGGPLDTWTMYADVVDVTGLFSFQVGFYFDHTAVQIVSVTEGGFLSNNGADTVLAFPGSIDNVNGVVTAFGWSLIDVAKAKSSVGAAHLITVQAKINPTLSPPYTGTAPGTPVLMMDLTVAPGDQAQTILMFEDGVSEITPLPANILDGTFQLTVTAHGPTAIFSMTPLPPNYVNTTETFDATASLPGFDGVSTIPIVDYAWDWGEGGAIEHDATPITTHVYGTTGLKTITLVVTDANAQVSAPNVQTKNELVQAAGCVLDVFTQGWRYIDPIYLTPVLQGKGPNLPAELFRPGDLVQLYATTVYNGDPVQNQLVSYEVHDNNGALILAGVARSDSNGLAEYDFRIPWPCTGAEGMFGTWSVYVTWEIGTNSGLPPFAKTQNDTMTFNVGWGIWSDGLTTDKAGYLKSEMVVIKVNIHNDYSVPVFVLGTANIYDDLMVPIGGVANYYQELQPGVTEVTFTGIHVEKWAFAGVGTVKANEFSAWPSAMGTAWCPEQVATFAILKTFNPPDP